MWNELGHVWNLSVWNHLFATPYIQWTQIKCDTAVMWGTFSKSVVQCRRIIKGTPKHIKFTLRRVNKAHHTVSREWSQASCESDGGWTTQSESVINKFNEIMHYIMSRISRAVIARSWDSLATTYITLNSVKNGAQLWVFLLQLHILQRHTWTLLMHHQQAVSIVGDTCKELNVVLVLYILQRGSLLLFIYLFFLSY